MTFTYIHICQYGRCCDIRVERWKGCIEPRQARRVIRMARAVWNDPLYVVLPDRMEGGEQRWHAIGIVCSVVVLVVVHSYPEPDDEDRVRIISARKATARERKRYEQESA